ncbi:MAG: alpha/beta fold hydrolase, partial [Pseudomonadales bacterium]
MNMLPSINIKPQLVLLHGWGFDRSVFEQWKADLGRYFDVRHIDLPGYGDAAPQLDRWCAEFAEALLQPVVLLGWSLGGQAAIQFAHRYPAKVKALVNLAGNPSFVQRDDWPSAMPAQIFQDFEQGFSARPEQTLRRFSSLVTQGASNAREQQKSLRGPAPPLTAQQQGLMFLRNWDVRSELSQLKMPVLHILGEHDQLVPHTLAESLRMIAPRHHVYCVSDAGHAVFLHNGAELAAQINQFAAGRIAKKRVAESFSKAATSYDAVAHLQRQVGNRLVSKVDSMDCGATLDLGSGTGCYLPVLQQRFPA